MTILNGPERIRVRSCAFTASSSVFSLYGWMLMTLVPWFSTRLKPVCPSSSVDAHCFKLSVRSDDCLDRLQSLPDLM